MHTPVGYAIDASRDWVASFGFANRLLRSGARVLVDERGSFIVPLSRSFDPWFDGDLTAQELLDSALGAGVDLVPLSETERVVATPLRVTRVGLYGEGGAPYNQAAILARCGFPVRFLSDAEVRAGRLAEVDVFLTPGVGVVTVRNERLEHPVMFGMPEEFPLAHYNGPVLDPLTERVVAGASAAVGLARFTGWTEQFTPAEGFAGPPASDVPTFLARAIAAGRFAIAAGEFGLGRVVAFGSHPEFGFDLPMVRWGQTARMLANAVLWQAASAERSSVPPVARSGRVSLPIGSALDEVGAAASALIERVTALRERSVGAEPDWLRPAYAMSVFGLAPEVIWRQSLDEIESLANEATELTTRLSSQIGLGVSSLDALLQLEHWLLDERPAEWEQDGGYQGVLALFRTATRMCDKALANWEITLGPPDGPYGYVHENPYHLVAGSYLAAIGCVAGAVLLMQGLEAVLSVTSYQLPVARTTGSLLATGN